MSAKIRPVTNMHVYTMDSAKSRVERDPRQSCFTIVNAWRDSKESFAKKRPAQMALVKTAASAASSTRPTTRPPNSIASARTDIPGMYVKSLRARERHATATELATYSATPTHARAPPVFQEKTAK